MRVPREAVVIWNSDEFTASSILTVNRSDPDDFRRLAQPFIKCCQGQAAPQGHFQICGIVGGQFEPARQSEELRFIVIFVGFDFQRKNGL